jgi:hypothetical protein
MSVRLSPSEYGEPDFELGEEVSFYYRGSRLYGKIVRVYNTRTLYHVEVDGDRYQVEPHADQMQRN